MLNHYNYNFAARFVSDYKLPISVLSEKEFEYEVNLYERDFSTLTKWNWAVENILKEYWGLDDFLNAYSIVRDKIINGVLESEGYKQFNNSKEIADAIKSIPNLKPQNGAKSVYNYDNVGHHFISFDMKKANFQTMRIAGIIAQETYGDFIGQFCDGIMKEYVTESKYTRQVVFGKLNPSRTINYEKYLMSKAYVDVIQPMTENLGVTLMYVGSDEIILRADNYSGSGDYIPDEIKNEIISKTSLDIRIEEYDLCGYEFSVRKPDNTMHKIGEFYKRTCDPVGKFKSIPLQFHKLIYKKMCNMEIEDTDRIFNYDKCCRAMLLDEFIITEVPFAKKKQ